MAPGPDNPDGRKEPSRWVRQRRGTALLSAFKRGFIPTGRADEADEVPSAVSMRADAGVCRFCGSVLQVEALRQLENMPSAVDAFACEDCVEHAREAGLLG